MSSPEPADDRAAARLAAWQGRPQDRRSGGKFDITTWARPQRLPLASTRRVLVPVLAVVMVPGMIWGMLLRIDVLAVDGRTAVIAVLIAVVGVFLPAMAFELWSGGTLEIDPAERELRRRSHRGRIRERWDFAQISAVDCTRSAGTSALRIEVEGRTLLATLTHDGGPVLARSLRGAVGLEPSTNDPTPAMGVGRGV